MEQSPIPDPVAGSTAPGDAPAAGPAQDAGPDTPDAARSFDRVADAYDRGRPGYPDEAVRWILDSAPRDVLELGAGTGKLTEQLAGHMAGRLLASDPSGTMLHVLGGRAPGTQRLGAVAESLPLRARSVDLVVAAQCFHWFDPERSLAEVARVLRPRGRFAAIWHQRDERVPWVRRLGRILGGTAHRHDPTEALDESAMFETVERATYRFWQPLTNDELRDLALSRSSVATLERNRRQRVLTEVDTLYDEYGRGPDGMVLPYVTTVCRATVLPWATSQPEPSPPAAEAAAPASPPRPADPDDVDPDGLLIDFR